MFKNRKLANLLLFPNLYIFLLLFDLSQSVVIITYVFRSIMLIFLTKVLFTESFFMVFGKTWILYKKERKSGISMQKY